MIIVRDCMFRNIATFSLANTLQEVMAQLVRQAPGFAVVLEQMSMVGLVTEYDLLRWLVQGHDPSQVKIGDLPLSTPHSVREDTPCQDLIQIYNQRRFRRFPVLNEDGMLSGGIMEKQILASLPRSILLAHYRVSDIVTTHLPVAAPETAFREVARWMVQWHRGCVLVSRGEQLLGIVSEGDMLRFRVRPEWDNATPVCQFMRADPITIEPEQNLLQALEQFRITGHRRLPVVSRQGQLVGLLTQTDLLKQTVHAARSRQAVLNPEDIALPAIWFSPEGEHAILAMNEKGAKSLALAGNDWVGRSVTELGDDPAIWDAITVLLHHCSSLGPIQLTLKNGQGHSVCIACRFQLIPTPTGGSRIFWTIGDLDQGGGCR